MHSLLQIIITKSIIFIKALIKFAKEIRLNILENSHTNQWPLVMLIHKYQNKCYKTQKIMCILVINYEIPCVKPCKYVIPTIFILTCLQYH